MPANQTSIVQLGLHFCHNNHHEGTNDPTSRSLALSQWWNLSTRTIRGTDQIDKAVCKLAVAVAARRPAPALSDSGGTCFVNHNAIGKA